ncbi:MAG: hypothetical protein JOY59_00250, partial [Candidatus Eremiobacteraeota bacterium]|nr:hypothetical protein [Candidatus Eremiobacteraeota bacterium]
MLARRLALLLPLVVLLAPGRAEALTQADLHARRINFYVERLALIADGAARLRYPAGPEVHGDSLYVDLRADRYLWTGHVRVTFGGERLEAAALSIDPQAEVMYALVTTGGLPRVERYERFDPASRKVVAPPQDAFVFPPLRDFRPYIYTTRATIVPKVNVRFTPALFPTSSGLVVPSPSYLYTYIPNPNFGATSLVGTNFDQPYGLLGSERTLTSAHFRYDSHYGGGIALTQQYVYGDRAYVALGAGPLRRYGDIASLLAYSRIDSLRSQTISASSGLGIDQWQYRFNEGVRHGLATATFGQINAHLTGDAALVSDPYPIARSGFAYRLRADYGFDRDPGGLISSTADKTQYSLLWRTTIGTFISSPLFWGPLRTRMNATLDLSQTWYAYPHQHDAVTLGSTISRPLSKRLNLVGQITDTFSGDTYPGRQLLFYPPPTSVFITPAGAPWPGYAAYIGYASQRTYSLNATYTSVPPFLDVLLNFTYARDFPQYAGYG